MGKVPALEHTKVPSETSRDPWILGITLYPENPIYPSDSLPKPKVKEAW